MAKPKDVIIDPEWEKHNELRGSWGTRARTPEPEPEDLDPFGVDKLPEPEFEIEPKKAAAEPFVAEPKPQAKPAAREYSRADTVEDDAAAQAEEPDPFAEPEKDNSRMKEYIGMLLSGSILSKAEVRKAYPYMLFLAFLVLLYISGVFRMQQLNRREMELTRQVKELRATSLELASQRMKATRQSAIIKELEIRQIPLKELTTPPKVVKK